MRLWPTTVLTPDDWIAEVTFNDGSTYRVGASPHLSEETVVAQVRQLFAMRNRTRQVIDIRLRRRVQAFQSVQEMHVENRMRLVS